MNYSVFSFLLLVNHWDFVSACLAWIVFTCSFLLSEGLHGIVLLSNVCPVVLRLVVNIVSVSVLNHTCTCYSPETESALGFLLFLELFPQAVFVIQWHSWRVLVIHLSLVVLVQDLMWALFLIFYISVVFFQQKIEYLMFFLFFFRWRVLDAV